MYCPYKIMTTFFLKFCCLHRLGFSCAQHKQKTKQEIVDPRVKLRKRYLPRIFHPITKLLYIGWRLWRRSKFLSHWISSRLSPESTIVLKLKVLYFILRNEIIFRHTCLHCFLIKAGKRLRKPRQGVCVYSLRKQPRTGWSQFGDSLGAI